MLQTVARKSFLMGGILLAAAATWAVEPLQVGNVYPITIDSTGRTGLASMTTPTGHVWELYHPDATYLALHFTRFELAPGDQVFVSDPTGGQRHQVSARGAAEDSAFWARHVKGDTLVLELVSTAAAAGVQRSAFKVEEYAAGFPGVGGGTEAICGADDKENVACYTGTTQHDRARAVARLLIQGRYLCTGWLVSSDSLLLTNEHCISSSREALNTDYEFRAEAPDCNSSNCQLCWAGTVYDGVQFIRDNPALDYALVRLGGEPATAHGFLEIDDRDAVIGEQIYMPQHPGGYAKEFGIRSTSNSGGVCRVDSVTAPACTGATTYHDVGYYCDTEGGSSGSPVLASSSNKVIALHHCGSCLNTGVPITLIYDEISQYLPPPSSCGDGECVAPEDSCSCADDCGFPPAVETNYCNDNVDNDCDQLTDCDDGDCIGDPACDCGQPGDPCTSNADCCSLKCAGKPGRKVCK
jgi:hypothetical protein